MKEVRGVVNGRVHLRVMDVRSVMLGDGVQIVSWWHVLVKGYRVVFRVRRVGV